MPAGTARLRLAVMASHSPEELRYAARVLGECARELGLDPARMGPLHEERIAHVADEDPFAARARAGAVRLRRVCAPPSAGAARRARAVRHRHRHGRRQERRQRLPAGLDARRRGARARLQAGAHRASRSPPPAPWPADHELLALAAGMRPEEVAPLRFGPAASPHLAAALAGVELDPRALIGAGARARRRAHARGRGRRRPARAADRLASACATSRRPWPCGVVVVARPGLGTINHTLLTLRGRPPGGAGGRWRCCSATGRREPSQLELSNRETIAALGGVEVHTLPRLAGPDPAELAAAGEHAAVAGLAVSARRRGRQPARAAVSRRARRRASRRRSGPGPARR